MNDFDRVVLNKGKLGEAPEEIGQEIGRTLGRLIKSTCKRMPAKMEMARICMEAMKEQMR